MRTYKWLAEYYDAFFTFHLPWYRRARRAILRKVLPHVRTACDLACATGTTALELARGGIKVYAVDLSPAMCCLARAKAARARLPVRIIRADMRSFRLPEPVDLILCEFDALNHVPRKQDLARVARAAARSLAPGGYFYFDVNNYAAFKIIWTGTGWFEKPGVVMVFRGGYDSRRHRGFENVEWFIRKGRVWQRRRERVKQVAWTPAEIRQTLRAAGFGQIRAWDATKFFRGDPRLRPGCRTFYLAQKRTDRP